jgi:hypothetical protein
MALSKCSKCSGMSFELKETEPRGAHYKQVFVQCSSCGTPVGVVPYYDPGALSKDSQKAIGELTKDVKELHRDVRQLQALVERLRK